MAATYTSKQALLVVVNRMGADLLPDNSQYINRMQIRSSSSNNLYVVAQRRSNGEWSCGCRGWIRHRHCKHLDTMLPLLEGPKAANRAMPKR